MCEWQDISTAPKDGEPEILTFTPKRNHRIGVICGIHVGFWSETFQEWHQSDLEWELAPSHWMPIPPPPETDQPDFVAGEF